MSAIERVESVCALSWINQVTGLPENDKDGPPDTLPGALVTREDDALPFRFLNLLEGRIYVTDGSPPSIVSAGFTVDSGIYRNPSYMHIPSEPFRTIRRIYQFHDHVIFEQTQGARTVSPEVIGESAGAGAGAAGGTLVPIVGPIVGPIIGRKIGRMSAHKIKGFPPIWTTLQLTLFVDGRSEARLLCHSLFPSNSFYVRPDGSAGKPRISSIYQLQPPAYDAVPALQRWTTDGWGVQRDVSGPSAGNPWGYSKDDLTIRDEDSQLTRIV